MNKNLIVFSVLILIITTVGAQTWEGDVSSNWNDPLNWSGNTLPLDGDDVFIDPDNYTTAPIMTANSLFEIDDLFIENGGVFIITAGDLVVRDDIFVDNATFTISGGTLDVDEITGNNNGNINLLGGIVTMSNDLDANSGSTFTISTTVTQTTGGEDLNIGNNATFIIQAGANITGFDDVDFDSDGGTLNMTGGILSIDDDFKFADGDDNTVTVSGGTLDIGDDVEIETDNNQITFNGTADVNVGGQFEFGSNGGGSGNDATNSNVTVGGNATLDVTGDINFYEGGSGSNSFLNVEGSGTVTTSSIDDLGSVNITESGTVNNGGTVLPVELLFFRGLEENGIVTLLWNTATELNNDFFEVLHSRNGIDFVAIAKIDGNGTTSGLSEYKFLDKQAAASNFYQLRQVDFDGAEEFFDIIKVDVSSEVNHISVYPNPINAYTKLSIRSSENMMNGTSIGIYSLEGKKVFSKIIEEQFPRNIIELTPSLPKGNYVLRIENSNLMTTKQIVIN